MCDGRVKQWVILKDTGEHPSGTKEDGGMRRKPREGDHSYMRRGFGDLHWLTKVEGRRRRLLREGVSAQT